MKSDKGISAREIEDLENQADELLRQKNAIDRLSQGFSEYFWSSQNLVNEILDRYPRNQSLISNADIFVNERKKILDAFQQSYEENIKKVKHIEQNIEDLKYSAPDLAFRGKESQKSKTL